MIMMILRLLYLIPTTLRRRSELALENLALRQQLAVLHRRHPRPKLRKLDRFFWILLSRSWERWKETLLIVKPETVRRECLDHVVVLGEKRLRQIVRQYVSYYHGARTHLALDKDAPEHRSIQSPERGAVIEIPEVGGLHHRYERRAS